MQVDEDERLDFGVDDEEVLASRHFKRESFQGCLEPIMDPSEGPTLVVKTHHHHHAGYHHAAR